MKQFLTFAIVASALLLTKNWQEKPIMADNSHNTEIACVPCGSDH